MERLFSPCTGLHDILKRAPHGLQELNLDVSTEELLSAERAFTYADLHAMMGSEDQNAVAWLTPHALVTRESESVVSYWVQLDAPCRFCFSVDGKDIIALAPSPKHLSGICHVVLRLLAASVVHSVLLVNSLSLAPTLAHLMEQCASLRVISLTKLEIDENQCRVLDAYSRPDLDIELDSCKLTNAGASALAEILGRNQGPTKLRCCDTDNFVLADGLRGNRPLKSLILPFNTSDGLHRVSNQNFLAIAGGLRENKGLVDMDLSYNFRMSEETWDVLCDSLKTHPTLRNLYLRQSTLIGRRPVTPAVLMSRMQALVDMLKVNMSIQTIHLDYRISGHKLFRRSVIPYLETNRVRAIQQTRPITYRTKVLGRALLSARTDANRFWMLLSGNAEVAFPSATASTTGAVNLPTPATVGASADAANGAANPVAIEVPAANVAPLASGSARRVL
jgi:hypothetical protein